VIKYKGGIKMRRLILVAILLALVLAPLEMTGVIKKGTAQLGEVVSSKEVQALVVKIKTELPSLGARITKALRGLFPQFEIKVKEVR